MFFKTITTPGLAHNSYFIAKGKEAVVIDPRRDIDIYISLAKQHNCEIKYIAETHRNEDYVIGSVALKSFTGATIFHGERLDFKYGEPIRDKDTFATGNLEFTALETPGHTPESMTYVISDRDFSREPLMAFTGDALFVGDTGRTDLWKTPEEAAEILYDSITHKIFELGDHVLLFPGHGGGSVCGGDIADRKFSSIGYEKRFNPKLQVKGQKAFIDMKKDESHVHPPHFKRMEEWNQNGSAPIHFSPPPPKPVSASRLKEIYEDDDITILDLREPQAFASGFIPGSYNIWSEGVSSYLSYIAGFEKKLVIVKPKHLDIDSVTRAFYRIGFDNIASYLEFPEWQNKGYPVDRHEVMDARSLKSQLGKYQVIDVRKPDEWEKGTIEEAHTIFLGDLERHIHELDKNKNYVTTCSVGHRGGVAASILKKHGFKNVSNFLGGMTAWSHL